MHYLYESDFSDDVFHARICLDCPEPVKRSNKVTDYGVEHITHVKIEVLDGQFKHKEFFIKINEEDA